ncbi:MAG TPA: hypothetical protein VFQ91_08605 [Bryobacteraceae bacterium]|nr:hypothetical protein [Bryobacteraceae bacterium]
MKNKPTILTVAVLTGVLAVSCSRRESPAVAEQQQPGVPVTAPIAAAPAPEPVRESAWRPAPPRSAPVKRVQPSAQPVTAAQPVMEQPVAAQPVAQPVAAAPAPVAEPRAVQPAAPPPAAPMKVTLAEGSILPVRVGETLNSEKNSSGDSWSGTLAEPLVINGMVIAERGARVEGRVSNVKRAGRVKGVANLSVEVTSISTADGQRVPVNTASFTAVGKDETKKDVAKVAIASGIGAAIGAIAGGGKGAGIGAGAGAAAGTGTVMVMRGGPAIINNETLVRFRVSDPVTITERIR